MNKVSREMIMYGLIPSDLPSLTEPNGRGTSKGGKVAAHALHAGHQILKHANHKDVKDYIKYGQEQGADFFNTAITLNGTQKQIDMIIALATKLGYVADKVTDPTYPYFIDREFAPFLDDSQTVIWEVIDGDKVLVTREQTTFGWLLGDKDDPIFRGIVGALNLAE